MVVNDVYERLAWPGGLNKAFIAKPLSPFALAVQLPSRSYLRHAQPVTREIIRGIEEIMEGDTDAAEQRFASALSNPAHTKVLNKGDSGGSEKCVRTFSNGVKSELHELIGHNLYVKVYAPHVIEGCTALSKAAADDGSSAAVERSAYTTKDGIPARLISLDEGRMVIDHMAQRRTRLAPEGIRRMEEGYVSAVIDHMLALDEYTTDPRLEGYFQKAMPEDYSRKFRESVDNISGLIGRDVSKHAPDDATLLETRLAREYRNMFDPWLLNYTLRDDKTLCQVDVEKAFSKSVHSAHRWAHLFFDPDLTLSFDARVGMLQDRLSLEGISRDDAYPALYFWLTRQLGVKSPESTWALLRSDSRDGKRLRGHLADYWDLLKVPQVRENYLTAEPISQGIRKLDYFGARA